MYLLRRALVLALLALPASAGGEVAPDAVLDARTEHSASSPAVARVGLVVITRAELAATMAAMPEVQRRALGATPAEVRRAALERAVVPAALYALEAQERNLESLPWVQERIHAALRTALVEELRGTLSVSGEEIFAYYEAHRGLFERPVRLGLWRILCASRDDAKKALDAAKKVTNAWGWKDLSREASIDRATKWRGGDLGFVAADGSSSEPALRVDPALFAAAEKVRDGELVPEPVPEGENFAVVWRRETLPSASHSLDEERAAITEVLRRQKLEHEVAALTARLRAERKVDVTPEPLESFELDPSSKPIARPPAPSARSAAAPPAPSSTPSGLR